MNVTLDRFCFTNQCTLGRLKVGDFLWYTLERPWRDNQPDISCIPPGIYSIHRYASPSKGLVLRLENVPNREAIEIHPGNYVGDTLGCILPGQTAQLNNEVGAVWNSHEAMASILPLFEQGESHTIEIRTVFYPRNPS